MKKNKINILIIAVLLIGLLYPTRSTAISVKATQTIADGTYVIKSALNEELVLDIGGAVKENGGNVQLWYNTDVPQQKYKVKYLGNGYYSMTVEHSGRMVDVSGGVGNDGTNVQQYDSNGTDSQKWIIQDAGDGYYYIISKLENLYLTVANGKASAGANIQVNNAQKSKAQKFKFEKANNINISRIQRKNRTAYGLASKLEF